MGSLCLFFLTFSRLTSWGIATGVTPLQAVVASHNHMCTPKQLSILSCSSASLHADACCTESPAGLLLLTQLYNWNPGLGPKDSWTIHGLWPDFCNGSYPASCDNSRYYTGFSETLKEQQRMDLLLYMRQFWRNDPLITTTNGTDEDLWEHEWAKHGTCMSSLRPSCYSNYDSRQELVEFLQETVDLSISLPTFNYLSDCGIVPTNTTTYSLTNVETCLTTAFNGNLPHVGCKDGYISEVWYYHHVAGKINGGTYVPTNITFKSSCPDELMYPPKLAED